MKALITVIISLLFTLIGHSQTFGAYAQQKTYCDCKEILDNNPTAPSGVYIIDPDGSGSVSPFKVYCNMTLNGGGWTLVMNNVNNQNNLDLNNSAGILPNDLSNHGNIEFLSWMNGSKELLWTEGTSFGSLNTILHVQENGSVYTNTNIPYGGGTNCPLPSKRYDFISITSDPGWSNTHYNMNHNCSGYPALGSSVSNYSGAGDCYPCYAPNGMFFGNGNSGYYQYGNTYDADELWWNGKGGFQDAKPSFWTGTNTHQLWIR